MVDLGLYLAVFSLLTSTMNRRWSLMQILRKFKKANSNNKIVYRNIIYAFMIKGGALIISLFSTPAFIKYFNDNTLLGVWYTLLSVLSWFLNFDLGLGNGIRNNLTKAFAENDRKGAQYVVSSGFFAVGITTVSLALIGTLLLSSVNLNSLFNVEESLVSSKTLRISSFFVFSALMMRFFLTTVSSVFYAMQRSSVNNFLGLAVSILQFSFVTLVRIDDPNQALIKLSIAYMVISNLPIIVAGIVVFATSLKDCRPKISCIQRTVIKKVMKIGGIFFVCQMLYMIIVNTNEFLITNFFEPSATTEYTFYYKITGLIGMMVSLAMTPIWSVVTKAMAEKNWTWINSLYRKIKMIGLGIVAIEFLSIPFLQFIMDIWLGENSITVKTTIALAFACFGSAFVYSSMLSTIVCGMEKMKLQAVCYGIGVIFKLVFVYCMSRYTNDWSVVVWSNALLLIPYCVLQQMDLNSYIKKQIIAQQ